MIGIKSWGYSADEQCSVFSYYEAPLVVQVPSKKTYVPKAAVIRVDFYHFFV